MLQAKKLIEFKATLLLLRRGLILLALLVLIVQIYKDNSRFNVSSNLVCFSTFIIACLLIFQTYNSSISKALTATVVFYIIAANSIAPMIGTLLDGHSLIYTLIQPETIFLHRFIFAIVLLGAHFLASTALLSNVRLKMSNIGTALNTRSFLPINAIWAMGCIGLTSSVIKHFALPVTFIKILDGFTFLTWVPFLLLIPPYWNYLNAKNKKWWLLLYYFVQVGLSFANNSRMGLIGPFAIVGMSWTIVLLMGLINITNKMLLRGFVVFSLAVVISVQLLDFSTAILMEREQRTTRSTEAQITATFKRFFDKESMTNYRKMIAAFDNDARPDEEWQENYIDNDFIGRFVQIKYDDNCFHRLSLFNKASYSALAQVTRDKTIVLAPDPLLQLFKIKLDKEAINANSIGDLMEAFGGKGELGGQRVGSIPAHSFALYGWFYPFYLTIFYLLIFIIFQGLITTFSNSSTLAWNFSTFGLFVAFQLFTNISLDGVTNLFGMLFRGIWQTLFVYYIALWFIKRLGISINESTLLTKKKIFSASPGV